MDVCPVGAITTRQYRFRSRPWDNPHAVDTICTLCSKGCSTTAWIKAKPEWAKGSRLVRMTPRYNPEVNEFWMCDIGRFQYTWVEDDGRLRKPATRAKDGTMQPTTWRDALTRVRDLVDAAGRRDPGRRAIPHLGPRLTRRALPAQAAVRRDEGRERCGRTYTSRGAAARSGSPRRPSSACRPPMRRTSMARCISASTSASGNEGDGRPHAAATGRRTGRDRCVVRVRPGPDGSLGDVSWLVQAKAAGRLRTLIYQGVQPTELAKLADVVLPGAAWVEKDATYTNDAGPAAGSVEGDQSTGRGCRRLADSHQHCRIARAAAGVQVVAGRAARDCDGDGRHAGLRVARDSGVQSPAAASALAAVEQSDGTLEVERRCSRICRPSRDTTCRWKPRLSPRSFRSSL